MIHFLLDSTSAIPESYLEQHENVHVVPLTISINQEYIPESDVTIEKVIECSERDKKTVPTSQPTRKHRMASPVISSAAKLRFIRAPR